MRMRSKTFGDPHARGSTPRCLRAQRGSSVLIIFTLLACMAIIVVANSTTLALLKQELRATDQKQQRRYEQSPRH